MPPSNWSVMKTSIFESIASPASRVQRTFWTRGLAAEPFFPTETTDPSPQHNEHPEPVDLRHSVTPSESHSTTGRVLAQSLVMRGDFFDTQSVSFGFHATSRLCIPRLSPRNSNRNAVTAAGGVFAESFLMRGDFLDTQVVSFGFHATSRHCIPRLSPRNSNPNAITANNGAAANWLGAGRASPVRTGSCAEPVAELESLGVYARLL